MISLLSFDFESLAAESYRVPGSCAAILLQRKSLSEMQKAAMRLRLPAARSTKVPGDIRPVCLFFGRARTTQI